MKYNSYHLRIQFAHDKIMYMSFTKGFQEQSFKTEAFLSIWNSCDIVSTQTELILIANWTRRTTADTYSTEEVLITPPYLLPAERMGLTTSQHYSHCPLVTLQSCWSKSTDFCHASLKILEACQVDQNKSHLVLFKIN